MKGRGRTERRRQRTFLIDFFVQLVLPDELPLAREEEWKCENEKGRKMSLGDKQKTT
jgi:hypothetical protein